jgi:hypothetical protein
LNCPLPIYKLPANAGNNLNGNKGLYTHQQDLQLL